MLSPNWFKPLLRCPDCGNGLSQDRDFVCTSCDFSDETGKDLRMRVGIFADLHVPKLQAADPTSVLSSIDTNRPNMTYDGPLAQRDSRELMSEVMHRLPSGGDLLDLGCGPRDQVAPLEYLGFRYVGVDYGNPAADFLADAHSLPFKDGSFDCVFSYAVLEHLHNPFIAAHEVLRVLKPSGWYIGTVSQGEPFHSSYFHHTPWALVSLIGATPGLRIVRMWESADTLASLASMGRYSRVIKGALTVVDWIAGRCTWLTPRKMRWPEKDQQLDRLYRAGSLCFSIQRVAASEASIQKCAA